jgi:hypothetical protein
MKIELKLCSLIQIAATPTWLLLLSVGCRTGALNESKVRDESSIEEITVQGRSYISSCGNYTATNADYEVKLKKDDIPANAKVTLVHAFSQTQNLSKPQELKNAAETAMTLSSTGEWSAAITGHIKERGWPSQYPVFAFKFKIEAPNQRLQWYKSDSEYSFTAEFPTNQIPCSNSNEDRPEFKILKVKTRQ